MSASSLAVFSFRRSHTSPIWVPFQKKKDQQGDIQHRLLGFTAVYRFFHYSDSTRMRLSQILKLPPYQRKGYGSYLVEVLSNVTIVENGGLHDHHFKSCESKYLRERFRN